MRVPSALILLVLTDIFKTSQTTAAAAQSILSGITWFSVVLGAFGNLLSVDDSGENQSERRLNSTGSRWK